MHRLLGFLADVCNATEYKEGNGFHWNMILVRQNAVAQFMQKNRHEEEKACGNAKGEVFALRPVRMQMGELRRQRKCDQRENDKPGVIDSNGDAEDFTKTN